MDKKKINIAIEQLERVHRDMNDCVNRFILKDAINQLQEQVKNCSIPVVGNRDVYADLRKLGLSSDQCSEVSDYIEKL